MSNPKKQSNNNETEELFVKDEMDEILKKYTKEGRLKYFSPQEIHEISKRINESMENFKHIVSIKNHKAWIKSFEHRY